LEVENFKPSNCVYFSPVEPCRANLENLEILRNFAPVEIIPERSSEVEPGRVVTNRVFQGAMELQPELPSQMRNN